MLYYLPHTLTVITNYELELRPRQFGRPYLYLLSHQLKKEIGKLWIEGANILSSKWYLAQLQNIRLKLLFPFNFISFYVKIVETCFSKQKKWIFERHTSELLKLKDTDWQLNYSIVDFHRLLCQRSECASPCCSCPDETSICNSTESSANSNSWWLLWPT